MGERAPRIYFGLGLVSTVGFVAAVAGPTRSAWFLATGVSASTIGWAALRKDAGSTTDKAGQGTSARWIRAAALIGAAVIAVPFVSLRARLGDQGIVASVEMTAAMALTLLVLFHMTREMSRRSRAERRLQHQSMHDGVTGLPNRALVLDRVRMGVSRLLRRPGTIAVLFLDLDRFKQVNEALGHEAGDQLLIAVGDRLTSTVRPSDTVGRFGGDEFVLVCEDLVSGTDVLQIVNRLRRALTAPILLRDRELFVTASIGVALTADPQTSAEWLIRDANAAMHAAKESGRDRHRIFDESMLSEATARLDTESDLHRAVDRGELRLVYQPIIDLRSGDVDHVEALVRWLHPERGLLTPDAFLPLAEATGTIVDIERWTLKEALGQLAKWRKVGGPLSRLGLSVNVSARHLRESDLGAEVREALGEAAVDGSFLCLELTEGTLIEDVSSAQATLGAVKDLGVRVAVDDFGTGYSSLGYLRRFPVDVLKIDRSFVHGVADHAEDAELVAAIVAMARALELEVVAEGVETPAQLSRLSEMGCHLIQGFLFARPGEAHSVEELARGGRVPMSVVESAAAAS